MFTLSENMSSDFNAFELNLRLGAKRSILWFLFFVLKIAILKPENIFLDTSNIETICNYSFFKF